MSDTNGNNLGKSIEVNVDKGDKYLWVIIPIFLIVVYCFHNFIFLLVGLSFTVIVTVVFVQIIVFKKSFYLNAGFEDKEN